MLGILFLFVVINPALASESILLPDLFRPELIRVDQNQIYITEGPQVYIYSLDSFKLKGKFGAKGEGPQEFNTGGMVFGWLWLSIQTDQIFVHSMGKISYYSNLYHIVGPLKMKHIGFGIWLCNYYIILSFFNRFK